MRPMRKILGVAGLAAGLAAFAPSPAFAETVTRTVTAHGFTISCVVTYTEMNGDARIDSLQELLSISDISCTVTQNT
jgi:hypothetical protein